jgi:hypothetical protein
MRHWLDARLLLVAGVALLLGAATRPTLEERLAAIDGDYEGGFHGDAAPGCGFRTELAHPDVWRIESNGDTYRFSTRSPFGNDFTYTGRATLVDGQIVVRGTYVATNVLGRGTFEHRIDAHDGAIIVTQAFASSTTPSCSGTGVDAGVRTGSVGSSNALPSPVPLGPDL